MKALRFLLLTTTCVFIQIASAQESTVKLSHIDVKNVDTSIEPCDNFYQYVCSKTIAANPIPPDQFWWGAAPMLREWNRQALHQILEQTKTASASRSPNEQKIGDMYASCMTQAASGVDDHKVLDPLVSAIMGMKTKADIAPVLAVIHSSFGQAWQGDNSQTAVAMFGFGSQPDFNDVSRIVAGFDQGGLGMPSRDFYLQDDAKSKAIREKYVALIVSLLQLDGLTQADATRDAATILRIETALAKAQMDDVTRRDPNKINNRYTLAQLQALTPAFNWKAYLQALHSPDVPVYEVSAPDFFKALNTLLNEESLDSWKLYLRWQLLYTSATTLGKSWRDSTFEFRKAVVGQQQQDPDWRRCTQRVDLHLGEALGEVYVKQYFPPESKERVLAMVKEIEAAMSRDIDSITWMQAETKRQAHIKLAAMINKIGYPDKWIDYSSLTITPDNFPLNVERATAFELARQLSFIGKPLDRTLWFMTPPTVNAYEDPQSNSINFPAGMLQPPIFDPAADDVINYGIEGSIMGHELTHDFDDEGRKFDSIGNLRDWWTAEDSKQYDQRGECIAKEYTGAVPGVTGAQQNGKLTQGEDTADNGGIYLALSALEDDLKKQGKTLQDKDDEGLTNMQRFFIAFASGYCGQMRPEFGRMLVMTDTHSLPILRVNNALGNMPEFRQAFNCKAGQSMVHADSCRVW